MENSTITVYELIALSYIKWLLGCHSKEEILKEIDSNDLFVSFVSSLEVLLQKENGFLFLSSDILDKIYWCLNEKRFFVKNEGINARINEIIITLNRVRGLPENVQENYFLAYYTFLVDVRKTNYKDVEEIITALGYDYYLYLYLFGVLNQINEKDYKNAIGSLRNFMYMCPILFDDKEIALNAKRLLEEIKKNSKFLSKNKVKAKRAYRKLKGLLKKEE